MGKLFSLLVIFIFLANMCFAVGLELSDIIKEAREAEKIKLSQNKGDEKSVKPVKNDTKKHLDGEQSACEKINPQEVLNDKK